MNSNIFHCAVEGGFLETTLPFYTEILGCKLGPCEKGRWQDIDFWGNELTLHESKPRMELEGHRHPVDREQVWVPHFGIHLSPTDYSLVVRDIQNGPGFLDNPVNRFNSMVTSQITFFVADPNFNVIEIKKMVGNYYQSTNV